jgi:hypothetical protein
MMFFIVGDNTNNDGFLREGCEGRKVRSTGAKRTPEQPDPTMEGHAQNSEQLIVINE